MADDQTLPERTKGNLASSAISTTIWVPCGAAAPLVSNGGAFVGCSKGKDHLGQHEVTIKWDR